MKKYFLILFLTLTFSANSFAAEPCSSKVIVSVPEMFCQGCVNSITAAFKKQKSVKSVNVYLSSKTVELQFLPEKNLSDKAITQVVKSAGYEAKEIDRKTCK